MANRTYEVMYIVQPETANDEVAKLNESVQALIEKEGGSVVKIDDIGRRKMAYEIKKKKEGYYVLFEIEGSGKEIAELERRFRVNDLIMRYITVRVDEDRKAAEKVRAKRERKLARRSGGKTKDSAAESAEVQQNQ